MPLQSRPFPALRHFTAAEFREWAPFMDHALLALLDEFRDGWGGPVQISPARAALGRHLGPKSFSLHNVDRWGRVKAVDIMPQHMNSKADMARAFSLARQIGFTGIGIAPEWRPYPGLHLDNRPGREPGAPAVWGYRRNAEGRQEVVGLAEIGISA